MESLSNIFTGLFFTDYWKMSDDDLKKCAKEHNIEAYIYQPRRSKDRKKIIKQLLERDNHKIANTSKIYMVVSIFCVAVTLLLTLVNSKLIFK